MVKLKAAQWWAWKHLQQRLFGYTLANCKSLMWIWAGVNFLKWKFLVKTGWMSWLCRHNNICHQNIFANIVRSSAWACGTVPDKIKDSFFFKRSASKKTRKRRHHTTCPRFCSIGPNRRVNLGSNLRKKTICKVVNDEHFSQMHGSSRSRGYYCTLKVAIEVAYYSLWYRSWK